MTLAKRNRTNSDVDDRTERDCVTRGRLAALNRGNIVPRWVDVMPQVIGPSLIDEAKREREALEKARRHIKAAKVAPIERPPEVLRRREMERTWYHRRMAERAGTNAQRAAEREAQRAAQRTPEQQKRHDEYIARKARKVES